MSEYRDIHVNNVHVTMFWNDSFLQWDNNKLLKKKASTFVKFQQLLVTKLPPLRKFSQIVFTELFPLNTLQYFLQQEGRLKWRQNSKLLFTSIQFQGFQAIAVFFFKYMDCNIKFMLIYQLVVLNDMKTFIIILCIYGFSSVTNLDIVQLNMIHWYTYFEVQCNFNVSGNYQGCSIQCICPNSS